jgi:hypothetical protein
MRVGVSTLFMCVVGDFPCVIRPIRLDLFNLFWAPRAPAFLFGPYQPGASWNPNTQFLDGRWNGWA